MNNSTNKILVTGGAGYIGSHVCNLLIDNDYDVTVIDNLVTGNKFLVPRQAKLEICDIADEEKVNKIINENKFNLVMHFAGLIRVDESIKKPKKYMEYNYEKTKVFLNICLRNSLNNIIFSSTAGVYGDSSIHKVSEGDNLKPLNPYALSKLKVENFIIAESKKNKINYIILRYFNVAGADNKMRTGLISKYSTHLIKIACEVALGKRKKLIINGSNYDTVDGTPVRDYIHVSDLAEIHLKSAEHLLKNGKSDIFNCGYGVGFSVKEVVSTLNEILSNDIKTEVGPPRHGDSKSLVANVDKFKKSFSWEPKFNNLKYILNTALEWEKKIKD